MEMSIEHLNPDGMHRNPAFSQAVVVTNPGRTIYIGGQNAVNAQGEIVEKVTWRLRRSRCLPTWRPCWRLPAPRCMTS